MHSSSAVSCHSPGPLPTTVNINYHYTQCDHNCQNINYHCTSCTPTTDVNINQQYVHYTSTTSCRYKKVLLRENTRGVPPASILSVAFPAWSGDGDPVLVLMGGGGWGGGYRSWGWGYFGLVLVRRCPVLVLAWGAGEVGWGYPVLVLARGRTGAWQGYSVLGLSRGTLSWSWQGVGVR